MQESLTPAFIQISQEAGLVIFSHLNFYETYTVLLLRYRQTTEKVRLDSSDAIWFVFFNYHVLLLYNY
jgi:hypothetical protein